MVPLVVRVEDLQTGAVSKSAFIKSPIRIGRSELNDLPLAQGFVSQWHAIVQFDDREAHYVDLGSTNGSIVGGARAERNVQVPIGPETEIRIGALKLTFIRNATGEHRAPPRTMFAIRAATAFRPAAPPAATGQSAVAATPPAPGIRHPGTPLPVKAPAPPQPGDAATAGPAGRAPAEARPPAAHAPPEAARTSSPAIHAAPSVPPAGEGRAAPAAPASPPLATPRSSEPPAPPGPVPAAPAAPPLATPCVSDLPAPPHPAPAPVAPGPGRADPPVSPALDLPTEFRMKAVVPPPALPVEAKQPQSAANAPPAVGPFLDLPTDFRIAAVVAPTAPPPARPPALDLPAAPVLDLPNDLGSPTPALDRPSSGAFGAAAPFSGAARQQQTQPPDHAVVGRPPTPSPSAYGPPQVPGGAPVAPPRAHAPRPSGAPSDAERLLATFAESYLPATVQIRGVDDLEAFLGKVAETIEAFARAFVEMRKGYEEFGKQMGIRTVHGDGPVQRSRDPRQLLASLLDPGQPGRAADLQAAFADYMVHQVALLNGVVEGAKSIVTRLSPEAIEAESPQSLWPMKAQALWKAFEGRYQELFEEESAISDALFGREFGKAYTAIVGQRGAADREDDDDDDDDRPKKKRSPPRRR